MNHFEILENKIRQAAAKLSSMKHESEKLKSEIVFLREENKRLNELTSENGAWREDKHTISMRIEKIVKKLSALKV